MLDRAHTINELPNSTINNPVLTGAGGTLCVLLLSLEED